MNESFLSYIWQLQYFDKRDLVTTDGQKIEIHQVGILNTDAGPDFSNARIKIDSINWIGNVEIHTASSEWFTHRHETDLAYDNVILHVVWKHDKEVILSDNTVLPTLQLRGRIDENLIKTYRQLITSSFSIPCRRSFSSVAPLTKISMLEKAMLGRLERKANEVRKLLSENGNNWEDTFYQLVGRNFGFKINSDPFFQLTRTMPLKAIRKHADKPDQVEALLFGQAGFLEGPGRDRYYKELQREYKLLSGKFSLQHRRMQRSQWKYLRLRPANFPSLRLAQFAALLQRNRNLFSSILDVEKMSDLVRIFSVVPSSYWHTHYQFFKRSTGAVHELGQASIENIIINSVVPAWVAYGKIIDDQRWIDLSEKILQQLPKEENRITRTWKEMGFEADCSFDSQGLIELYNNFCSQKKCLDCTIGASLMRPLKQNSETQASG